MSATMIKSPSRASALGNSKQAAPETVQLVFPGDAEYDSARAAWNTFFIQHPAVVALPTNPAEVTAAVKYANAHGLAIGVQATGHGPGRLPNGAMLINLSRMTGVVVDPVTRTAWIEGGAKWSHVLPKAHKFGLAPLLGSTPDVGAIGYTLGGGLGWLARQYGTSADRVRSFQVVLPDGRRVRASAAENPDLFWGLKGGGGNFGVVVSMEVELVPVSHVYGGNLYYPAAQAPEIIRRFRDWIQTLPREMTASVGLFNYPDIPDVPEPLRAKSFIQIRGCYTGSPAQGEALFRPWRVWQAPEIDDVKLMPFSDIANISNDPLEPLPAYPTGVWLTELTDQVLDTVVDFTFEQEDSALLMFSEIRFLGGYLKEEQPSAYGNRQHSYLLETVAVTPTAEIERQTRHHVTRFHQALSAQTGGIYPNFYDGEDRRTVMSRAYTPESYQRLRSLKSKYDPSNLLRFGFGLTPELDG